MSDTKPVKVLVTGPVDGAIRTFLTKLKAINSKHGPFDLVLSVGDFFAWRDPLLSSQETGNGNDGASSIMAQDGAEDELTALLDGSLKVPAPTYIFAGSRQLPERVRALPGLQAAGGTEGEVCENLFLLGTQGLLKTTQGVKVAYLGGMPQAEEINGSAGNGGATAADTDDPMDTSTTTSDLRFFPSDVAALHATLAPHLPKDTPCPTPTDPASEPPAGIDILLTFAIPRGVTLLSPSAASNKNLPHLPTSSSVADVAKSFRPRYHFAPAPLEKYRDTFWEREPYATGQGASWHTRFIVLAAVPSPAAQHKARWFYAANVTPLPRMDKATLAAKPANASPNPYTLATSTSTSTKRANGEGQDQAPPAKGGKRQRDPWEDFDIPDESGGGGNYFFSATDTQPRKRQANGPPPARYVCRICNEPGHWIQDCPQKAERDAQRNGGGGGEEQGGKRGRKGGPPPDTYVCRLCGEQGHWIKDCVMAGLSASTNHGKPRMDKRQQEPTDCWFCLSTPTLLTHLLVSISSECYLTIPRGSLVNGGHYLAVTVGHYPSLNHLVQNAGVSEMESQAARKQVDAYLRGVRAMEAERGNGVVVFEAFAGGGGTQGGAESKRVQHYHVQCVSIPGGMVAGVDDFIRDSAAAVHLTEEPDLPEDVTQPYLRFQLPNSPDDLTGTPRLLILVRHASTEDVQDTSGVPPFLPPRPGRTNPTAVPIQFARICLADYLGVNDRSDWKKCVGTEEEETKEAEDVKSRWEKWEGGIEG